MNESKSHKPLPVPDSWELVDGADLPPDFLDDAQDLEVIKVAPGRCVFRRDGRYIKAFKRSRWAGEFRDQAQREWSLSLALRRLDLSAPPVAYGKTKGWSYFVAEEGGVYSLSEFFDQLWPVIDGREKRRYVERFCRFVVDLAEAGLFQPDFHLNNVLYDPSGRAFRLIDLHRAQLKSRPLTSRERLRQLEYLLPPFWEKVYSVRILRFVALAAVRWPELRDRRIRYRIQERAFSRMRRNWGKKFKRRLGKGYVQERLEAGGRLISLPSSRGMVREFFDGFFQRGLDATAGVVKNSRHTVTCVVRIGGHPFFLKLYRSSGPLRTVRALVAGSRAEKSWMAAQALHLRNIPTPLPLAAFFSAKPVFGFNGAILYPLIGAGHENLAAVRSALGHRERAPRLLSRLTDFVWEMHGKGVFHGDGKITNFHIDSGTLDVRHIYDLDGTRIRGRLTDEERLEDLAALSASLEWWGVRPGVTKEILRYYAARHLAWEDKFHTIFEKLSLSVTKRMQRKKRRGIPKS